MLFVFMDGSVSLTVTAWVTNVNTEQTFVTPWQRLTGDFGVYKGSTGLGVKSHQNDGSHLDGGSSSELDDLDEGLLFSFSEDVYFIDFWATYLTENDDFNFSLVTFLTDSTIETRDVFLDIAGLPPVIYNGQDEYSDVIALDPNAKGKHFMIWVDGNDDDARISHVGITQVPEPGVLLLLSFAILLLTVRKRT